jgi:hypothetical protein
MKRAAMGGLVLLAVFLFVALWFIFGLMGMGRWMSVGAALLVAVLATAGFAAILWPLEQSQ